MLYATELRGDLVWSQLPIELTREIILYLASTDDRTARNLRLVCRSTNVWVLPLLFRSLTFTTPEHITRFASILLPKRKLHIPALKSDLHNSPRALSSYSIESLALVVNTRLPSVETALANVALAFSRLKNLFITSKNLSSNGHWLRRYPIRPTTMMLLHFGSPHLVNYKDPIFQSVTHLYTSTLAGYRGSHVTDLPQLTHLAVHTRLDHPPEVIVSIAIDFLSILEAAPQLKLLVFTLDAEDIDDVRIDQWVTLLASRIKDSRFIVLPYFRHPRMEWEGLLREQPNVWERAVAYMAVKKDEDTCKIIRYMAEEMRNLRAEKAWLAQHKLRVNWEIDLVQREGYIPYEGDLTEQLERESVVRSQFPSLKFLSAEYSNTREWSFDLDRIEYVG
ncbi:hypothetical protein DXG01_008194 [Tephrocybe rancida]|nr:hypothetical protein DXG01_008194 [Tephrocybe rancida]